MQNVILCNEQKKEVTVMQSLAGRQQDKSFSFDKVLDLLISFCGNLLFFFHFRTFFQVFGPKAQQRSIYEHAISPIVNDTLEGFNCTVFAYGQTGTGKTFTMEGDIRSKVPFISLCSNYMFALPSKYMAIISVLFIHRKS